MTLLIGEENIVYAWDGSVSVGYINAFYTNFFGKGWAPHLSDKQEHFKNLIENSNYPDRTPYGLIMYMGYDKDCDN